MKEKPKIGASGTQTFLVESRHAIDFADQDLPAVLATPFLVGFLERTARLTLAPCLDESECSLGIEIELAHQAPTPVGAEVHCQTRIIHVEGTRVSFQLEAKDESQTIARGFHKRVILRKDRFAKRVPLTPAKHA